MANTANPLTLTNPTERRTLTVQLGANDIATLTNPATGRVQQYTNLQAEVLVAELLTEGWVEAA